MMECRFKQVSREDVGPFVLEAHVSSLTTLGSEWFHTPVAYVDGMCAKVNWRLRCFVDVS